MTDTPLPGDIPYPPGRLSGRLERVDRKLISGWAADASAPGLTVELEVLIDDEPVGTLPARIFREDLAQGPLGNGYHGFRLHLPQGLSGFEDHVICVRRAVDGVELEGSPQTLAAEPSPPETVRQTVVGALELAATTASREELDALIILLAKQASELLFTRGTALADPQSALCSRWATSPLTPAPDNRPRALFIDEGIPDPTRDAGANAAISHMQALQRLGMRVDFVAAYGLDHGGARTQALASMGITCWHAPWIGSVEEVLHRFGEGLDIAYLHRFGIVQRYGALVRRWCPNAKLLYCVADLHHLRLARQRNVEIDAQVEPAEITGTAAALRTAEFLAALGADAVITHSSFEAELLCRELPEARVHLIPWAVAPNPTAIPFAGRCGIAFIGSYGHPPNLDAAHVLVEQIMPMVWAKNPAIPCLLVGSDLPASLRNAAAHAPEGRLIVLGYVPTLQEIWDRVRLTIAPLRFGAGLKGKVLDSLAGGIPCICSPMAVEGMDLPDSLSGLVASGPAALATLILHLHEDAATNAKLSESGLSWIGTAFAPARIDAELRKAAAGKEQAPRIHS